MRKLAKPSAYFKAAALTSLALASRLAIAPAQAQASPAASAKTCPTGAFCLYENINYGGGTAIFTGDDKDLTNNRFDNGHPVNDRASSMINNTQSFVELYKDIKFGTRVYTAQPNSVDSTFVNNGCHDMVSSIDIR